MKIGIIREGKNPPDKRVPLSPKQCEEVLGTFPGIDLVVQPSKIRCFKDEEYKLMGIPMQSDLSDCDVLMGVKEVPVRNLLEDKTYFFFSHTIKEQPYNKKLMKALLEKNIQMVDYETLTAARGNRLVGFGRYAGIVGAYNGFLAWGKRSKSFDIKPANLCEDRVELEEEMKKITLPSNFKMVLTGKGKVAHGSLEIIRLLNLKEVSPNDFINEEFTEPVFTNLDVLDYNKRKDGQVLNNRDFYTNPEDYISDFSRFSKKADMFIAGHFYGAGSPYFFTREDAKNPNFKLKVIADISCDIDGPVASTIRPSTIADPIYGYNRMTEKEDDIFNEDVITVMAVDNLPCELPKDASSDFGAMLIEHILPALLQEDPDEIIERASICKNKKLTGKYEYLSDYAYN